MIPIHDFSKDDGSSIPFKFIPLSQRADYDTSHAHRHNYYEIFLFASGGGDHEIDFGSYSISSNSIHFVSPGQVHCVRRNPDSFGSILLFSRDFYYFGSKADLSLFEYPFLNGSAAGAPVLELVKNQFDELLILSQKMGMEDNSSGDNSAVIRSYLHIFLLKCRQFVQPVPSQQGDHKKQNFSEFQRLLEQHFREQHLSSFYADSLNISSRKLNEACMMHASKSSMQLIKERLMLEARRLLLHDDLSVKEIAYFLGFDDPAYFNRFFKRNEGIPAGDYRRQGEIVP